MGELRLQIDEWADDVIPFPTRRPGARVSREFPRLAIDPPTDAIHAAEDALDRLDRQLNNLRHLLGPDLSGPDAPRAA